jgi:Flp pilus assembly pilin Flp
VGIEYAMVAALVSAAFFTTMTALGQNLDTKYSRVAVVFEGVADTPPADVAQSRRRAHH